MAETFEAALARVKSFQLGTLGEEAIKQGVILPLLRAVGWDTDDISQLTLNIKPGKGSSTTRSASAMKTGFLSRPRLEV